MQSDLSEDLACLSKLRPCKHYSFLENIFGSHMRSIKNNLINSDSIPQEVEDELIKRAIVSNEN